MDFWTCKLVHLWTCELLDLWICEIFMLICQFTYVNCVYYYVYELSVMFNVIYIYEMYVIL